MPKKNKMKNEKTETSTNQSQQSQQSSNNQETHSSGELAIPKVQREDCETTTRSQNFEIIEKK
jgi:sortase (surface protein transpeptidase)